MQIGFDQLSPLALSTRDLVTRLLSPKGYGFFISNMFEGGLNGDGGGLFERGGFFN